MRVLMIAPPGAGKGTQGAARAGCTITTSGPLEDLRLRRWPSPQRNPDCAYDLGIVSSQFMASWRLS
jgi:hypothetical protein